MDRILCLVLLLGFAFWCQGLELYLNKDQHALPGTQPLCGILVCTEDVRSDMDASAALLSMYIVKRVSSDDEAGFTTTWDVLIGKVSARKPYQNGLVNGIKVNGTLNPSNAKIRVDLVKTDDCEATFFCYIRSVDSQGIEMSSVVSREKKKHKNDDSSMVPSVSPQVLTSIRQLITRSMGRFKDKMKAAMSPKVSKETKVFNEICPPSTCEKRSIPVTSKQNFSLMLYAEHGLNFPFFCDTVTDNGGWILIQRRSTGNINFDKSWSDYKQGFGSVVGDFWLGNDIIHNITSSGTYELRVELRYDGKAGFAHYDSFSIADEKNNYKLKIGKYDGTAGDSLTYHADAFFSTTDKDNDSYDGNCAKVHGGGWWFKKCDLSNLNGRWGVHSEYGSVEWTSFSGNHSASYTEMKIRQV